VQPSDLLPQTLRADANRRLFCFPHAGGGAALFYRWQRYLPNDLGLVPMRLPGREDRLTDPLYSDIATLASDAALAIQSAGDRPFVLVGHSLGAYVAMEVARQLVATGGPLPSRLIVAACGAPRTPKRVDPIGQLPDDDFLDQVAKRFDGIPDAVRENAELLAMVLPALRADIQMMEAYTYQPGEPLPIDILALGGADDRGVAVDRLAQWREQTTSQFTMRLFPGGHFFLHPSAKRNLTAREESLPAPLAAIIDSLPSNEEPA